MAEVNPMKETFLLGSLNVALPTFDVYSDIALATKLYYHGLFEWASLLLGPFLVNYTLAWIAWFTTEKKKKFSWIAALLGCYPQLVATRIIWLFWTQPLKGVREKKNFERNLIANEIFTEAVPTVFILTFLWIVPGDGPMTYDLLVGEFNLFLVTYITSVLSAGLGLAKCLKVRASYTSSNDIMMMMVIDGSDGNRENNAVLLMTMMMIMTIFMVMTNLI